MVLGIPCLIDYGNISYALQKTFSHLLPRRLQARDADEFREDHTTTAARGGYGYYNTSQDQNARVQAKEKEQELYGKVSGADVYQSRVGVRQGSFGSVGSGASSRGSGGLKKEVRWEGGVVGGEEYAKGKRASISRVV